MGNQALADYVTRLQAELDAAKTEIEELTTTVASVKAILRGANNQIEAERERVRVLREKMADIADFCRENLRDCSMLASMPPQNPVAYHVGWRAREALAATEEESPVRGYTSTDIEQYLSTRPEITPEDAKAMAGVIEALFKSREKPKSMSQKMHEAGFTRRPSGKAIGDDE
jgi:hypothetical protein